MPLATPNARIQPQRMLSQQQAAEYVGVPKSRFGAVRVAPVEIVAGVFRYDVHDLDSWIDNIKIGAADSDDDIIGKLG